MAMAGAGREAFKARLTKLAIGMVMVYSPFALAHSNRAVHGAALRGTCEVRITISLIEVTVIMRSRCKAHHVIIFLTRSRWDGCRRRPIPRAPRKRIMLNARSYARLCTVWILTTPMCRSTLLDAVIRRKPAYPSSCCARCVPYSCISMNRC